MPEQWDACLALMRQEMCPALGCTEPVAVALACAKAKSLLPPCEAAECEVELAASRNILKNAMCVMIPGTRLYGAEFACALGIAGGDAEKGLEVLSRCSPGHTATAEHLVAKGAVTLAAARRGDPVYIDARVRSGGHTARAVISGSHDHFVLLERDGEELLRHEETPGGPEDTTQELGALTLQDVLAFAEGAPVEKLALVAQAIQLNCAISADGLRRSYGLGTGPAMRRQLENKPGGGSLAERATMRTLAAIDARMDGCTLAAMSNSGSGNQGITATVPVWSAAQDLGADDERTLRAVALSHMTTIYIKEHMEKLSSLCGAIVAAAGACCGVAWLRGGGYEEIESTIINILAGITGMICDGAKAGCALKVAAALNTGFQAVDLALEGVRASGMEGIVDWDAERSIDNLGRLTSEGMRETDRAIWEIMLQKTNGI